MMWPFTRCTRAVALVAVVVVAAGGPARRSAGAGTTAASAPTAGTAPGRYDAIPVEVPAVTLVDDRGAAVRLDELLATSEPVALQFIFTSCPGVCPTLSSTLAALGREVPAARLVSISIDPEVDTVARLAEYKAQYQGGEHWSLLTGTSTDSIAAQQAFASYRGEKMRHQALTFLKPAGSREWLRFEGFPSVEELAEALVGTRR